MSLLDIVFVIDLFALRLRKLRKIHSKLYFEKRASVVSATGSVRENGDLLRYLASRDVTRHLATSC
jgi:hypothetical protein